MLRILFSFQKGFDEVPHKRLLKKVSHLQGEGCKVRLEMKIEVGMGGEIRAGSWRGRRLIMGWPGSVGAGVL